MENFSIDINGIVPIVIIVLVIWAIKLGGLAAIIIFIKKMIDKAKKKHSEE